MKDGKPTKPRLRRTEHTIVQLWTAPEKLKQISEWAGNGYSDKDIAEKMGISVPTFRRYRLEAPEIDQAVQDGKNVVDHQVESALLKAALGFTTKEVKVVLVKGKEGNMKAVQETTTRYVPPNVLACQTWLFNRQREKWKRNRDNEITTDADDQSINITIKRAGPILATEGTE
ncbi:MAG: hypothetical protein FWE95_08540 [Planctomycetaceae bacterium]|nr:hypothetical protein [Planctomycetaceae bacterium]